MLGLGRNKHRFDLNSVDPKGHPLGAQVLRQTLEVLRFHRSVHLIVGQRLGEIQRQGAKTLVYSR